LPRSRDFSVSPDGTSVAFLTEPQTDLEHVYVYVADLDGTGLRRVTTRSSGYAYLPRWSPDGTKIVYVGCCSDDVYVLSLESGRSVRLTHERESVWDATFSADGSSVLFTMAEGEKLSLWRVSTAGGRPTVLISNAAFGTYSPDGSTIAFRRNHPRPVFSSCPDCWLVGLGISFANSDGSEPQAASDTDDVFGPIASAPGGARWSPDGSRIVYRSDWNSIGELLVLDVATGMNERIGSGVAAEWVDNDTLLVDGFERS
jgi:Tol biopolymer transport system component